MQADFRNDYGAVADYIDIALIDDPENPGLLQNGLVAHTALGEVDIAAQLGERLLEKVPEHQLALAVLLADHIAEEDYDAAGALIEDRERSLNPLLRGLLAGWIAVGEEDYAAAQETFDALDGNDALAAYGRFHKALALALAGDFVAAEGILAGDGGEPLHLNAGAIAAHAQVLVQLGRQDEALAIIEDAQEGGVPNALIDDLAERLGAGEEVGFTRIANARAGAAEAYLTLADALDSPEGERIALIHAQLAVHIDPDSAEARLVVAELLERQEQYALASEVLSLVPPESPWSVTSEVRRANTQQAAGDAEAGIATLLALRDAHPDRIEVHAALGDAYRTEERFEESSNAYDGAIDLIDEPQRAHWVLFYTRGIARERSDQWDGAEADFRTALELEPDQPLVLNYLGYSMVEQRRNLDEALDMIERAVAAQPDDGYITDSLGWVLYRLGRYPEALPHMLRAVELTPDDPIINDHLGDVLWKVGRKREAEFQWRRALSFGPADDLEMERIRSKLDIGLDSVLEQEAAAEAALTDG